jgi:hypothetical protein
MTLFVFLYFLFLFFGCRFEGAVVYCILLNSNVQVFADINFFVGLCVTPCTGTVPVKLNILRIHVNSLETDRY